MLFLHLYLYIKKKFKTRKARAASDSGNHHRIISTSSPLLLSRARRPGMPCHGRTAWAALVLHALHCMTASCALAKLQGGCWRPI
jgi:hypothetical protein